MHSKVNILLAVWWKNGNGKYYEIFPLGDKQGVLFAFINAGLPREAPLPCIKEHLAALSEDAAAVKLTPDTPSASPAAQPLLPAGYSATARDVLLPAGYSATARDVLLPAGYSATARDVLLPAGYSATARDVLLPAGYSATARDVLLPAGYSATARDVLLQWPRGVISD